MPIIHHYIFNIFKTSFLSKDITPEYRYTRPYKTRSETEHTIARVIILLFFLITQYRFHSCTAEHAVLLLYYCFYSASF
jgi:hypothetical protein